MNGQIESKKTSLEINTDFFDTPILFLIFNRPILTQLIFNEIRKVKPKYLFIAADGARENKENDKENCIKSRKIIEQIDWECNVKTLFRENNFGCKIAVSSAITWFFENCEEGIILEDDCLPEPSFFKFCGELLKYYKNDSRIMQICGSNYLVEWDKNNYSYFFSKFGPIWGWASWRRAWNHYDVNIKKWGNIKNSELHYSFCENKEEMKWREELFDALADNKIDTWDYQFAFTKLIYSGLSIIPKKNLIKNIGFGNDATHTTSEAITSNLNTFIMDFPLKHPDYILRDKKADEKYLETVVGINSSFKNSRNINKRFLLFIKKILNYLKKIN